MLWSVKIRDLQYKVRRLQYKIRYLQAFAGTAFYLQMPVNILQLPGILCQITVFLCCSCHNLLGLVMAVLD
jgi:hypothetical protein